VKRHQALDVLGEKLDVGRGEIGQRDGCGGRRPKRMNDVCALLFSDTVALELKLPLHQSRVLVGYLLLLTPSNSPEGVAPLSLGQGESAGIMLA
jgi:hypothetical protein